MVGVTIHAKSDSDVTSVDASSPPRSPRRPLYYVQSPSQHDVEKMSYASSPPFASSPIHHHYHCSPIHHSRESSTSRFSASLKTSATAWKRLHPRLHHQDDHEDDRDDDDVDVDRDNDRLKRFYLFCFLLSFLLLFTIFSLILWAASTSYQPTISVKSIVFENFNVQSGMDGTGLATDMLTLKSTVRIFFRNPATFFGVHVTATPLELHYYQLKLASGHMKKFYQSRKSQRIIIAEIKAHQVPLYGGVPVFTGVKGHVESVSVPLNLTISMRSRAYILGRLVKPKFYRNIICEVTLRGNRLGKFNNLKDSCVYHN